jgi:hypothetical protein
MRIRVKLAYPAISHLYVETVKRFGFESLAGKDRLEAFLTENRNVSPIQTHWRTRRKCFPFEK